jgi:cardiolipin synthase
LRKLLPNAITALRLLLIIPFGWSVIEGRPHLAFGLLTAMAISDVVDGYLARRWRTTSPLGAFLDPLADKLTQVVGLVLLAGASAPGFTPIPAPLVALVLARDLVLAYGTWRVRRRIGDVKVRARWEGKASTLCIFVLLLGSCLGAPRWFVLGLSVTATPLVVASGIRYVRDGVAQVRERSSDR